MRHQSPFASGLYGQRQDLWLSTLVSQPGAARDARSPLPSTSPDEKHYSLQTVWKRKFIYTSESKHDLSMVENILNRAVHSGQPNAARGSDITYIRTRSGWLYLSGLLNLYSRKVVGWSLAPGMSAKLV
ncbi:MULTISPECIES: hypothetical protein [unclassified Undibacterium]|uniref:hypothetical protein n=1 Tax=unclassified Undibacterium TaxID=2630295 RepID=UPI003C2AB29B